MKKKSIALISILRKPYDTYFFETGIAQLADYLRRNGNTVKMFFFENEENVDELASVSKDSYDYYAFSVCENNVRTIYEVSKRIKDIRPNADIVCGGQFATTYYIEMLESCKSIDYIIIGDGEIPFQYLIDEHPIDNYPYIVSQNAAPKIVSEYMNKCIEWGIADDYYQTRSGERYMHVLLSKNNACTGHCTFCSRRRTSDIILKPIAEVADEVIRIYSKHNITNFYFADDDLFDPGGRAAKDRIGEMCDALIESGHRFNFSYFAKVTACKDTPEDRELLAKMRRAGFVNVFLGLESGNSVDLKLFNKRHSVEDNYKAIELYAQQKINVKMGFINFHPWSTQESLRENFIFLKNIKAYEVGLYANSFLKIYKGSALHRLLIRDDLASEEYDYLNLTKYRYKDPRIVPIMDFLRKYFSLNLSPDQKLEEYSWHHLSTYYDGLVRLSDTFKVFENEMNDLREEYHQILDSFFGILFLDNDIRKAESEYGRFYEKYIKNNEDKNKLLMKMTKKSLRLKNAN